MTVPYLLPINKTIVASNGNFIIKEIESGYELWEEKPHIWLLTSFDINDFREDIGKVFEIR